MVLHEVSCEFRRHFSASPLNSFSRLVTMAYVPKMNFDSLDSDSRDLRLTRDLN